jgi:electron transport complex protein RnfG
MREMIKLFVVVTLFSALSGGLLATVKNSTQEKIEYQQLKFVKGPTIKNIMAGCSNDPLIDRFKIMDGEKERIFFLGVFKGKPNAVALESFGKGFGGDIGVIIGVNLDTDKIIGMGVTTHSETPGLGSRTKTDPSFSFQFKGISISDPFGVKQDGGQIDAVSGATISSQGVCAAMNASVETYKRLKPAILKKANDFKG